MDERGKTPFYKLFIGLCTMLLLLADPNDCSFSILDYYIHMCMYINSSKVTHFYIVWLGTQLTCVILTVSEICTIEISRSLERFVHNLYIFSVALPIFCLTGVSVKKTEEQLIIE